MDVVYCKGNLNTVHPRIDLNWLNRLHVGLQFAGNYLRHGKLKLFETLLYKEENYVIYNHDLLLKSMAKFTNTDPSVARIFLKQLVDRKHVVRTEDMQNFDSVVR